LPVRVIHFWAVTAVAPMVRQQTESNNFFMI
jgi:hypothetical protein